MLTLHWERAIALPPHLAWSYLTEPELMNQWSLATIDSVSLGDGAHPGGVGALRRVTVNTLGSKMRLDEVIEMAVPGKHLAYRVYAGAPVRLHAGNIEIHENAQGSVVHWRVNIDPFVASTEPLIRHLLYPQVAASLDRLAAINSPQCLPRPHPPARDLDELAEFARIEQQALAIRDAQRAVADELLGRNDARGWFARVYEYVSDLQLAACQKGRFAHPAWVAHAVIAFDPLYRRNLDARLSGNTDAVEAHWARAFTKTERMAARAPSRFAVAMRGIFEGMRAHIEDDLPRALAQTYMQHYAKRVDYQRFRADYLRMAQIFGDASDRLLTHFPKHEWTLRDRFLDAITPPEGRTWIIDRTFYPITQRRAQAFERGGQIAELMLTSRDKSP